MDENASKNSGLRKLHRRWVRKVVVLMADFTCWWKWLNSTPPGKRNKMIKRIPFFPPFNSVLACWVSLHDLVAAIHSCPHSLLGRQRLSLLHWPSSFSIYTVLLYLSWDRPATAHTEIGRSLVLGCIMLKVNKHADVGDVGASNPMVSTVASSSSPSFPLPCCPFSSSFLHSLPLFFGLEEQCSF